jgi:hypothetical protein
MMRKGIQLFHVFSAVHTYVDRVHNALFKCEIRREP